MNEEKISANYRYIERLSENPFLKAESSLDIQDF